MCPKPAAGHPE